MTKQYYSIITDYGTKAIANAIAKKQPLQIMQMAVGDGNGKTPTPNSNNTALIREVHRANISAISVDPRNNKQIIFELTIPENIGGFWIREMGIFDHQNQLIAYANCPDSFKPQLDSGSGKVQVIRMILLVSSSNAITLKVDDSVIFVTRGQLTPKTITATSKNGVDETGHSHEIDKASTEKAGITQLVDDLTTNDSTKSLTARAGFLLKGMVDSLTRSLTNYIPNSKKSDAISSNSSDTVATSKAVKSLNDIKANKATTLEGYGITDFIQRSLTSSDNLNEMTVRGLYYNSTYRNCEGNNYPEITAGTLLVLSHVEQVYFSSNGKIWKRLKGAGNWLEKWVRIDSLDKADKVGDEIKMKTIDHTKAEGYAYSGFYRPNSAKLGDKGLQNLMIHINHPNYQNNAHARGISFDYGSADGDRCWDLFTTAFDKEGNYLGYKKIMTELGGQFNGDVSLGYNNKLFTRRISSIANASYALDLNSKQGIFLYNSEDFSDLVAGFRPTRIDLVRDVNLANKMLAFSFDSRNNGDLPNSTNIDGIWHDDNINVFHFQSDSPYKTTGDNGNATLAAKNYLASGVVNISSNQWERLRATLPDTSHWRWEVHPNSATDPRFNFVYRFPDGTQRYLNFPTLEKHEKVAYQSWIESKISDSVSSESSTTVATSKAVKIANDNANGRVSKSGDTMTGKLVIEHSASRTHGNAGIALVNTGGGRGTAVHFDGHFLSNKVNKGGLHITDTGDGGAEVAILTTPAGDPNTDRRQTAMIINNNGALWVKHYGWLHDYFAKLSDVFTKGRFQSQFYQNHYEGAGVYRIPITDNAGIKIIIMRAGLSVSGKNTLLLPERFDGFCIPTACDVGEGRYSVGISMNGNQQVDVWGRASMGVHITIIGWGNF